MKIRIEKIEISSKKGTTPTSYKEKYEQLKTILGGVFQYLETSYQTSPETLLINATELDLKLDKNEINHKQAYFNLLNTCYEKAKNNSLAVFLKADPEQISQLNLKNLSHDILLRKELPTEIKKEDPPISILTPEGLFQPNPNYHEPSVNNKKDDKDLFISVLTKEELQEIGFKAYLERAEKSLTSGISIKGELIENQLIYDLDKAMETKKKDNLLNDSYLNSAKFHTCCLLLVTDEGKNQLMKKNGTKNQGAGSEFSRTFSSMVNSLNKFVGPLEEFQSPANKGANGLVQIICSFGDDIYAQFNSIYAQFNKRDGLLIELMDSIGFLGEEKITSYKKMIKKDTDFKMDVKNLIEEIIINVYNHSKVNSADKNTCLSILNRCLIANNGDDFYELHKADFNTMSVSQEQYITYTMDQWIENRKNNTNFLSFPENMMLLLKQRTNELDDFTYDLKQNSKEDDTDTFLELGKDSERTYTRIYPSEESIEFKAILKRENPLIVQALHKKYQNSKTTPEIKAKVTQFIQDLDQFESEVNKLQLQADLLRDTRIGKATKSEYCNKLKLNVEVMRTHFLQKHDQLKIQLEEIFVDELKSGKKSKGFGAALAILGFALIVVGVALAVLTNPLFVLVAGAGTVSLLVGIGLFNKGLNTPTGKLVSEAYTQGEKAIKSIEAHEKIEEPKVKPEDNKPTNTF